MALYQDDDFNSKTFVMQSKIWAKLFIGSLILFSFLPNTTHGMSKFSSRLYCELNSEAVRVYLHQEKGTFKCREYVSVLNYEMRKQYSQILQVEKNLNRGDDVEYRSALYETKKRDLLQRYRMIQSLKETITAFERSFLIRAQEYVFARIVRLRDNLSLRRDDLQKELENHFSRDKQNQLNQLDQILADFRTLQHTDNIDLFMSSLNSYLSLLPLVNSWK